MTYDHSFRYRLTAEQVSIFLTLLFIPLATDAFELDSSFMINTNSTNVVGSTDSIDFTSSPTSSTFSSSPLTSPSLSPLESLPTSSLGVLSLPFDLTTGPSSAYDHPFDTPMPMIGDDKTSMVFGHDFYTQLDYNNMHQHSKPFFTTPAVTTAVESMESTSGVFSGSSMASTAAAIAIPLLASCVKMEDLSASNGTTPNRNRTKENARKRKLQVALANAARLDAAGKRLDRLQRNRASAQLSRERKKNYLRTLELQVKELMKVNADLSSQLQKLHEETERERKNAQPRFSHGAPFAQSDFLIA